MAVHAPKHLSPDRRRLWKRLVADYGLDGEPHAMETLRLACEALDRCDEARRTVERDGAFLTDRFGQPKTHPAVGVERDARVAALRAFRELSLDGDVPEARPPRVGTGSVH